MKSSLSIVTPSYNQGRFIERTIRSVLDQDVDDLEYFIVDGGSTDETIDILRRFEGKLRWISEPDRGQADAVNKGIRRTANDIIGWLNSDDVYYPGALRRVQNHFAAHPDLLVLYGDADHIDVDDRVIEPYYTEDWNYRRLLEVCYLCQPAVFFRRRAVQRCGFLDASLQYCMDYEYWLRLGAYTSFERIPVKLAGSRFYAQNKTLRDRMPVHREINEMLHARFGSAPTKWIFNYAHTVADYKLGDGFASRRRPAYLIVLAAESLKGILRWKKRVSMEDLQTVAAWIAKGAGVLQNRNPNRQ